MASSLLPPLRLAASSARARPDSLSTRSLRHRIKYDTCRPARRLDRYTRRHRYRISSMRSAKLSRRFLIHRSIALRAKELRDYMSFPCGLAIHSYNPAESGWLLKDGRPRPVKLPHGGSSPCFARFFQCLSNGHTASGDSGLRAANLRLSHPPASRVQPISAPSGKFSTSRPATSLTFTAFRSSVKWRSRAPGTRGVDRCVRRRYDRLGDHMLSGDPPFASLPPPETVAVAVPHQRPKRSGNTFARRGTAESGASRQFRFHSFIQPWDCFVGLGYFGIGCFA